MAAGAPERVRNAGRTHAVQFDVTQIVEPRGNDITIEDLPPFLRQEKAAIEALEIGLPRQGISLDAIEKELILKALQICDWNQTHAARYLDISPNTLTYRIEKHGIQKAFNGQESSN